MDDLSEKLNQLLSSPEGMAKIKSTMDALSGHLESSPPAPSPPPPAASNGPDLSALTKLLPLLSGMGKENEDTRLLQALRPYLHGERAQRLEETMRLLQLARLLPLLQDQNILGKTGGNHHGG